MTTFKHPANFRSLRIAHVIAIFLMPVLLSGQSMQLALDASEWNGFSSYPVKGRQGFLIKQKLSFGIYFSPVVDRSWVSGSAMTSGLAIGTPEEPDYTKLFTKEHIRKKQTLFFCLKDSSGLETNVYCASRFKSKDFNIGNNPVSLVNILGDIAGIGDESSDFFYVQIYSGEKSPWHLMVDNEAAQRSPGTYRARLIKNKETYYTLAPHALVKNKKGKVGKMPFGSAGFQIRNGAGVPVAAVSLIDKGVVYLPNISAEERLLLASVCAALLLREEI